MSNLKTIDGGKVKPEDLCQHCGLVPQTEHPAYSCPRLSGVSWDGDAYDYAYAKYDEFLMFMKLRAGYAEADK